MQSNSNRGKKAAFTDFEGRYGSSAIPKLNAEPAPSPVPPPAPVPEKPVVTIVGDQKVEDFLTETATAPIAEAHTEEPTPAPKTTKKAKPAKTSSRRAKDKDNRTERMTFYVSKEEEKDIKIAALMMDTSVTYIGRKAALGLVYNGYVCAVCGKSFILLNDDDAKKDKPSACPCCGNDKLGRIVNL